MTDLRKLARGRDCQVRLPGCTNDTETTVLAHVRIAGISGMSHKAPDLLGAYCCYRCHLIVDRQTNTDFDPEFLRLALLEGMARTQTILIREGVVKA